MISTSCREDIVRCATGIRGLDEVTGGGLPEGGLTLVRGRTGCGNSTLAMEFLVRGVRKFNEQGLFLTFEERSRELLTHFASLDWNLTELAESGAIRLEEVLSSAAAFSDCREAQELDLDAMSSRLEQSIEVAEADRVVLDGALEFLLRDYEYSSSGGQDVRRLLRRLKDNNASVVMTSRPGVGGPEEPSLAERLADCVLDLSREDGRRGLSDRILEVQKYLGGGHRDCSYPFVISSHGLSVLPIGSITLEYSVSDKRISTGVLDLDAMLGDEGFYRGAAVLVTGSAGTGKTTLGACFVESACSRGERALYLSFEEPTGEIIRNKEKMGMELDQWINQGNLRLEARRPAGKGPGAHILSILREVEKFEPQVVVIDPLPAFIEEGDPGTLKAKLTHLVDRLKKSCITTLFTDLTPADHAVQAAQSHVASLMDTWINLRNVRRYGQRSLLLEILKSRGTEHTHKEREMSIGERGLSLPQERHSPGVDAGETGRRWLNARSVK